MAGKKYNYFVGDFETTVYEGQEYTSVWASGLVQMYTENVEIFGSIDSTFDYLRDYVNDHGDTIVYYHNLKFDGEFWLSHFHSLGMEQAYNPEMKKFIPDRIMPVNTYKYVISDKGQWYYITVRFEYGTLYIRDSLKLLPFSVEKLGKSFGTKHRKLSMVYEGERYPNCPITVKEREYLKNDLLVVKEALEIMFDQGHTRLTIGSCCLHEYKRMFFREDYDNLFPNLYKEKLPKEYGSDTIGDYINKSYGGGWCYLLPAKANKKLRKGLTADVNSLYPSMMHSDSGNRYPVGYPKFWRGDIPEKALEKDHFYFVRFKCRFYLKPGKLPFVHIRHDYHYKSNENLVTSDHYNAITQAYHAFVDGKSTAVTLTMCGVEYELFRECYNVEEFEVLDGCWFNTEIGIFDDYINHYRKIKETSTGAVRESAKLFLNNLYGKLAMSTSSSFKIVTFKEDGSVKFETVLENDKKPGYIPCGSAITAYARRFTILAAIANYHGADKGGFAYADTDSIHCDNITEDELIGIPTHDTKFNHWKIESHWYMGLFVRQKTYLERTKGYRSKGKWVSGKLDIKCAGMPEMCKEIFSRALTKDMRQGKLPDEKYATILKYKDYIEGGKRLSDFKVGLRVPAKLFPRHVRGGIILKEGDYNIK